jgi:hypothetical protein
MARYKNTEEAVAIALNTQRETAKGARKSQLEEAYSKYVEGKE